MTKSTITRERAQQIFLGNGPEPSASEERELARMTLVAMDSEPVAWTWHYREQWHVTNDKCRAEFVAKDGDVAVLPLYRHAQPVPVVPEEKSIPNTLSMYAVDAVAAIAEVKGWNACRAAMLQASPVCTCPSGDGSLRWPCPVHPGNSPVIPDGWTGNDKANAALMMLDRIETADPVDDDRIDGIKRIVREFAAATHDTPALNSVQSVDSVADRWIPVSERIPDNTEPVLCIEKRADFGTYGQPFVCWHDGGGWVGKTNYRPIVTHWMPLPAGPQEVR